MPMMMIDDAVGALDAFLVVVVVARASTDGFDSRARIRHPSIDPSSSFGTRRARTHASAPHVID